MKVYCDGSPNWYGFYIPEKDYYGKVEGTSSSHNEGEYKAVLLAIRKLIEMRYVDSVELYVDSQLVANQLNGIYDVKHPIMRKYYSKIKSLMPRLKCYVRVMWIPREKNLAGIYLPNAPQMMSKILADEPTPAPFVADDGNSPQPDAELIKEIKEGSYGDNISELAGKVSKLMEAKGFKDEGNMFTDATMLALIMSEVGEAIEELRKPDGYVVDPRRDVTKEEIEKARQELVCRELADVVIRILDYAGRKGVKIGELIVEHLINETDREYKHGKRF